MNFRVRMFVKSAVKSVTERCTSENAVVFSVYLTASKIFEKVKRLSKFASAEEAQG